MKYTLSQIAKITGGRLVGADRTVRAVVTDSRNSSTGDSLFVALTGCTHDGHDHIEELRSHGVGAYLVNREPSGTEWHDEGFVVVDDTLAALQSLAAYHRSRFTGTVVAITGSNGKTIVKEWFAQLWLPTNGVMMRSPGSYNSQLGVALSLLMIRGDERVAVIEAGISKPGEMERLWRMIRPEVALMTNLGKAHGENFTSREHKLHEKHRLFEGCSIVLDKVEFNPNEPIEKQNLHHVLRLYEALGIDHKSPEELRPIAMRLELEDGLFNSVIINDSYSNDLTSLEIAMNHLSRIGHTRRALILSDIPQSGIPTAELYHIVSSLVHSHGVDLFVGVGMDLLAHRQLFDVGGRRFFETTTQLLESMQQSDFGDMTVLIKGGRSFGFERISAWLEKRKHTTRLEVNLERMAQNLSRYRAMTARGCRMMAMVKANSYGSGSRQVALMLEDRGVDYLAVAFADEGVALRRAGIHIPIIVLNSDPSSFDTMVENGLEPEIYSFLSLEQYVRQVSRRGISSAPIHLKFDTGMHRLGFTEADLERLLDILNGQSAVRVSSVFSHLAAADCPEQDDFTRTQIATFGRIISHFPDTLHHICNTAGIERFPEAHLDMVRLGIGLYEDVSTLRTLIVQTKDIPAGESVGYSRMGRSDTAMRIAIIPIGYADGLTRRLSRGRGQVRVGDTLCPIVGNICMDTTIIDITGTDAHEGDDVVIFGESPTVEQIARSLETISYEVLTSVSSRIKRVYIQ